MVRWRAPLGVVVLLLGVAGVVSCFPPPLDETGLLCSAARPCSDGFVCFDGVCQKQDEIDAGPSNWLFNPGFEDGGPDGSFYGWRVNTGAVGEERTNVHSGQRAIRVFSLLDGGESPTLIESVTPVRDTVLGQVWCARAFARAEFPPDAAITVGVYIRERDDAGNVLNDSTPTRWKLTTDWQQIDEVFFAEGASRLDTRIAYIGKALPGQVVVVDDIALKRSATTSCTWP